MIRSYRDARTEVVASGKTPKGFPSDLLRPAVRKLTMLENAVELDDLRSPPGNRLEALRGTERVSIASASMINGAYASYGPLLALRTLKLLIIIERSKP